MNIMHVSRPDFGKGWCAYGDKDRVRSAGDLAQTCGKRQATRILVGDDQFAEPSLINRNLSFLKRRDLGLVHFDAKNLVTEVRQARRRNEADVASANHHDPHQSIPSRR